MKKMVCSLLAFLLLTGCAPAVDPDLTPESIMENALRKSEEEVQEALGISFEGAETGAQPNYYLLECSVPFGDQVADQIEFQFYKGKLACVRYTFSSLGTPEETWDFLAGMAQESREQGLRSAMEDIYGHGSTYDSYDSFEDFQAMMREDIEKTGYPKHIAEDRLYVDERTYVAYTMDFNLEYPIFMGIQYAAAIVRPLDGEPYFQ